MLGTLVLGLLTQIVWYWVYTEFDSFALLGQSVILTTNIADFGLWGISSDVFKASPIHVFCKH